MKENVLIIAPHPDDFFISCSGFIIESADNFCFDILCMTYKNIKPKSTIRIQEEEDAVSALAKISKAEISLSFFKDGKDTELYKNYNEMVQFIESQTQNKKYKLVFCPFPEDTHQDHREVSKATLSATRYQKNIIFFETPSTINFHPTSFIELSENNSKIKEDLSKIYQSQILGRKGNYRFTLSEFIHSKLISNGAKSRTCKYAEGFKPYRIFLE